MPSRARFAACGERTLCTIVIIRRIWRSAPYDLHVFYGDSERDDMRMMIRQYRHVRLSKTVT